MDKEKGQVKVYEHQHELMKKVFKDKTKYRIYSYPEMRDFILGQGEFSNSYGGEGLSFVNALEISEKVELQKKYDQLKADFERVVKMYGAMGNYTERNSCCGSGVYSSFGDPPECCANPITTIEQDAGTLAKELAAKHGIEV